jgi:abortive infection bacteriophage resistance protein
VVNNLKPALQIEKQIDLLKQRGMIFSDKNKSEIFLLNNNYYRLNIYFHKFMDVPDHFIINTYFDQIINVYENDSWFRNKLIFVLENIEITIKSQLAYYLALNYGSGCFYDNSIQISNCNEFRNILTREIDHQKKEPIVKHHLNKYQGKFPIWVIVEFFSFNSISKLFACLPNNDKKNLAQSTFNINEVYLESWLHSLSVLRNICAHYGYLYQRNFSIKPNLYKSWNLSHNNNLFAICLIMKTLSSGTIWNTFMDSINQKANASNQFQLSDYGFLQDWKKYLI